MAYGDIRSGCRPIVLATTVAGHLVLLAVAAIAIHGPSSRAIREPDTLVALFESTRAPPSGTMAPPPVAEATPQQAVPPPAPAQERASPTENAGQGPLAVDMRPAIAARAAVPALELSAGEEPRAPPEAIRPLASATTEADALSRYLGVLRSAIAARTPRGLRKEGEALVAFRLDRSGQLLGAEIARPSGDVQLDRLALRMVRQATPFPAPDAAIPEERLNFTIPVRFH